MLMSKAIFVSTLSRILKQTIKMTSGLALMQDITSMSAAFPSSFVAVIQIQDIIMRGLHAKPK